MNKYPKFKAGDKVKSIWSKEGVVSKMEIHLGKFRYLVKFPDGTDNTYYEEDLKFNMTHLRENNNIDIPETCPVCSSEWTVTKFGATQWYDCLPCNKTAEELIKASEKQEEEDFGKYGMNYRSMNLWGQD